MTVINLGVNDVPYSVREDDRRGTARVAEILEDRYHIIETFARVHEKEIAEQIAQAGADAIEHMARGAPTDVNFMGDVESWIEHRFREFISLREIEALGIPGVPTEAARRGKSRRFGSGKTTLGSRPSFIDTGLYVNSFKVWVDG